MRFPIYFFSNRGAYAAAATLLGGMTTYLAAKVVADATPKNEEAGDSFQEVKSNNVFKIFKPHDALAMTSLILTTRNLDAFKTADRKFIITDIGGGDGDMSRYFSLLACKVQLNIVEPNERMLSRYIERVENNRKTITLGEVSINKVESPDYRIPKSDLLLTSHSLYYSRRHWQEPILAKDKSSFEQHMMTKLVSALNEKGILCVILQSGLSSQIQGQHEALANLEAFENVSYPMIEEARHHGRIQNRDRDSFANAEGFEKALVEYAKHYHEHTGKQLVWKKSALIKCCIPLGNVNFEINTETGKYHQPPEVLDKLNQYTRNKYNEFSAEDQKTLLDFIKQSCQSEAGAYYVTHVNRAIVIMRSSEYREEIESFNSPSP